MKMKKSLGLLLLSVLCLNAGAIDNKGITFSQLASDRFTLVENGAPNAILIDEQEDAAAVLGRKIGEAPDVAEAHRRACSGENESDLARKGAPLVLFLIHWIFLFSQIQYPQCITAGEGIQPIFR